MSETQEKLFEEELAAIQRVVKNRNGETVRGWRLQLRTMAQTQDEIEKHQGHYFVDLRLNNYPEPLRRSFCVRIAVPLINFDGDNIEVAVWLNKTIDSYVEKFLKRIEKAKG